MYSDDKKVIVVNKPDINNRRIMVTTDGKFSVQLKAAVNKASWMLGRIRKMFRYFYINIFKKMFPTFVGLNLEFASSV